MLYQVFVSFNESLDILFVYCFHYTFQVPQKFTYNVVKIKEVCLFYAAREKNKTKSCELFKSVFDFERLQVCQIEADNLSTASTSNISRRFETRRFKEIFLHIREIDISKENNVKFKNQHSPENIKYYKIENLIFTSFRASLGDIIKRRV